MKKTPRYCRAFTLVELLVVIAIIVLLSSIVMTNLTGSRAKARDAKRVSDIGHLQLALELYFDRCKQYPSILSLSQTCTTPGGNTVRFSDFISVIPTPPRGGSVNQTQYGYYAPLVGSRRENYVVYADLESNSEVLRDSLPAGSTPGCGSSDYTYCVGPK